MFSFPELIQLSEQILDVGWRKSKALLRTELRHMDRLLHGQRPKVQQMLKKERNGFYGQGEFFFTCRIKMWAHGVGGISPLREGTHKGETGGWSRRVLQPGALGSVLTMLTSWINTCTWCWEEFVSKGPFKVVWPSLQKASSPSMEASIAIGFEGGALCFWILLLLIQVCFC